MFKIQGAAKHESVATPENGTQMISQDRLALGKTKTKAAIKILLPAKATKKAPQVAQRKPKQRRSTEKKLKMSEYLHNDHLKALSLPKLIYTMRLATAQLHLHFSWMYRVLQAMETFRVLNANYLNLILEGARLREANAPLPDWMPPEGVEAVNRLFDASETTQELVSAGVPPFVCSELVRRVVDKDLVGSESMVAPSDDEGEV